MTKKVVIDKEKQIGLIFENIQSNENDYIY